MAFDKTTSGKLIEIVHDYTDLSQNQRRYLIGPRLGKVEGADKMLENQTPESEPAEDEDLDTTDQGDSFFMKLDDAVTDQEESRTRRLEF